MHNPIACSLDGAEMRSQLDEWRTLLAHAVAVERRSPVTLTMRFQPDVENITTIAALAQREVACCPFFRFVVEIDSAAVTLTTSVPPDAAAILDAFAALAS